FDAGNTLVFLDYARLARAVGEAMGLPLTPQALEAAAPRAALAMEQAEHRTDRERGAAFLLALFALVGVGPERAEQLREVLLGLHVERHLWASSDARVAGALARLRDAGFRMGVVSNSDGRAASALEVCGLLDFFEIVIDSGAVGVEKPDPRIFALALDRMGLAPRDALYVGDLYEVDVVGARAAGLDVVLLDPAGLHGHRDVRTAPDVVALADMLLAPHPTP
ncbi:MAG TPA: HAD family hydrolase, partial [Gemmatimonadales bacterium]|nr:HAD family hydrolase [Gemmatimonadales bacterium]